MQILKISGLSKFNFSDGENQFSNFVKKLVYFDFMELNWANEQLCHKV